MTNATPRPQRPEVLAPAGDWDSLRAALASGADAVYFGLDSGFNARARAKNFERAELDAIARACRRAGARAYLTLNTLIFEEELPVLEALLRDVARSGIDALIVQDPATALIAKALAPTLELHASTQMTISSPEAARFATRLGISRIVLPRELSIEQIGLFAQATRPLELEVFVHGALCMSWSGQCLTSEAWGGRSANRGQCAQSCRLPYELVVDGVVRPLGEVKYLLSPRDLAGHDAVPALMDLGVHTFKIEGRLKGPAYVNTSVTTLKHWIDAIADGRRDDAEARADLARELSETHRVYSRGFTSGFFFGGDHQTLVDGRFPKHRGARLGTVVAVQGERVTVERVVEHGPGPEEAPPEPIPGMGVGFDAGDPEAREPGGPIFTVEATPGGWVLGFGRRERGGPDLSRVKPGQRVWATGDVRAEQRALKLLEGAEPEGRIAVALIVSGRAGEPLSATVKTSLGEVSGATDARLEPAKGAGLSAAMLEDKLGALGGTPFRLQHLDASCLEPDLFVPPGALKALRRALIAALEALLDRGARREVREASVLEEVRGRLRETGAANVTARAAAAPTAPTAPTIVPLCRSEAQLEAAIAAGCDEVELDFMELVGLGRAVARAKAAGLRVTLATTRVQKPGEEGIDQRLRRLGPDGLLVRHWGGLVTFAEGFRLAEDEHLPIVHGDFSLNVTNSLTGHLLLGLGLETVTASHDLDERQLFGLLDAMPEGRVCVVVHHHVPTFHTEHCVYAHTLSTGRDYKTCGRPCERHEIALVDSMGPVGLRHPVITDVGCRNTVFEARAQSAAALVPRLVAAGVRRLRVELVRESAAETTTVLSAYRRLAAGQITPKAAVAEVGVHEQFGVVRGIAASART